MTQPSVEELLTARLREAYGDRLVGVILFGSRARGDHKEWSDYDVLLVLDRYTDDDPIKTYFEAYRSLKPFRDAVGRDTTVIPVTLRDLIECASTSLILNALYEGRIIYDRDGSVKKVQDKLLAKLKELGVKRVKEEWGYTWIAPPDLFPFKLDIRDPSEHEYRLKLAEEHLEEAERALSGGAVVAAAYEAQLSIENSAKAVIALFKSPNWVHNPAPELRQIMRQHEDRLRGAGQLIAKLEELAALSEEAAPHHALASYGDARRMRTPRELYTREEALNLIEKARRALSIARECIEALESPPD